MAKLGTKQRPAFIRVQTMERLDQIVSLCEKHGWKYVAGVDPDKPEDVRDVTWLLREEQAAAKVPRNTPCPCGSGTKYKHCCGR